MAMRLSRKQYLRRKIDEKLDGMNAEELERAYDFVVKGVLGRWGD